MDWRYEILKRLPVDDVVFRQLWVILEDEIMETAKHYDIDAVLAKGIMRECTIIPGMTVDVFGHAVGFLKDSYEKEHMETFMACVKNSITHAGIYVSNVKPYADNPEM